MIKETDSTYSKEDTIVVSPINRIRGELRLPGDKSISHRAAMISAIANGQSVLENFSSAHDCAATLQCLRDLGVQIGSNDSTVTITAAGKLGLEQPAQPLDAQNSGTTMRLLAGIVSSQPFLTIITGDESLRARPMLRIAQPLRLMTAKVETEPGGTAPIRISGRRPLQPIQYKLPVASAQIKSAVLFAGLGADGETTIEEPAPTRDHTERMLPQFGVPVKHNGNTYGIQGGLPLHPTRLTIPGDISSAAVFIAAALTLPDSDLVIRDVGVNPTRTAFLSLLQNTGSDITILDERTEGGEPVGTLRVRGTVLNKPPKLEVQGEMVANLIDELPLLAFLMASMRGEMKLSGARELRVKESDRISATVKNLSLMGATIEERDDGWLLLPGAALRAAHVSSFGDHRIAMACAVAALSANAPTEIEGGSAAVAVSLPEFWNLLESVTE